MLPAVPASHLSFLGRKIKFFMSKFVGMRNLWFFRGDKLIRGDWICRKL